MTDFRLARRLTAAVVVAALAVTACSNGGDTADTAQLQDEVAAQSDAVDALRQRVRELEDALREATGDSGAEEAVTSLDERLSAIDERMVALEEQVGRIEAEATDRARTHEDAVAELRAGQADLDDRIGSAAGAVAELRATVQRLIEDLDLLTRRFETHVENHGGG